MEIKEYLPFYIGCPCKYETSGHISELKGVFDAHNGMWFTGVIYGLPEGNNTHWHPVESVKPILRRLSSMTEEESYELECDMWQGCPDAIIGDRDMIMKMFDGPEQYRPGFQIYVRAINWLRKNSFDCDDLIDSNLAIESTKPHNP